VTTRHAASGLPSFGDPARGGGGPGHNDPMRPKRDDAWPRGPINTVRGHLPPRERLGAPGGPSFRTLFGWFLSGPILLGTGLQAIWVEPDSRRGWVTAFLGLCLVMSGVHYALRPVTIERDKPEPRSGLAWGPRTGGPRPGPPADTPKPEPRSRLAWGPRTGGPRPGADSPRREDGDGGGV
jgi:hypothetical protein